MEHYGSRFSVEQAATLNAVRNSCAYHGQQGMPLRSLLARCEADGRPLLLGPGVWRVQGDITVPAGVHVFGCGRGTLIDVTNGYVTVATYAGLHMLRIDYSSNYPAAKTSAAIECTGYGTLEDMWISGAVVKMVGLGDYSRAIRLRCSSFKTVGIQASGDFCWVVDCKMARNSLGTPTDIQLAGNRSIASRNVCELGGVLGDLKYLATGNHQVCCNQANEVSYP